jgi:hypothetical protein
MKYIGTTIAVLVFAIATPALAGKNTVSSAHHRMHMKQKTCKKEASEQHFGVHMMKKRAFIKECMSRV